MVVAAVAASSCTKEISDRAVVPTVDMELAANAVTSKTSLSEDRDVFWSISDELSFFDGTDNRKLTAKSANGSTAVFTGQVAQGCTDFLAVYPYNSSASADLDASTVTTAIPASQFAIENSFGDGCNIALSKGTLSGTTTSSTFYNACQLIRFTIPSYLNNVTEVTIASQDRKAIAGTATFDFSGDEPVLSSVSGANRVTLTGNFLTGGSYYAVVAPVDFVGITVTMTSNGIVYTKNSGVQITGSRNHTFDIGEINFPAQAACTISHYNDASGNLAGSNAVVSLTGVADNVTAWSADLYKGETKVRSVSVTGGLSSSKIMTAVEGWPYLPVGTYTLKNVIYVRNGKNVKCENVAVHSPAPNFNCKFSLKGYTSYDVYKNSPNNAYGKSGADAANELKGSTVYGIGMSFTGISPDLMGNDNYMKQLTCSYDGIQVASATSGTSLNAGDKTGQSWEEHKVEGAVTFDGVHKISYISLNVTGLPFEETFENVDAWDITGNTTKKGIDGFKLGGGTGEACATLKQRFRLPASTSVKVSSDYYLFTPYVIINYTVTTYTVSIGGKSFISREAENTKNEEKFYSDPPKTGIINGSALLKIESSYTKSGPYVRVKNVSVLYN